MPGEKKTLDTFAVGGVFFCMTGESRKCYNNSRRRYLRIPPVYGAGWNSIGKNFQIKYNDSSIDQVGEETLIIVRSSHSQ